jgi:hypothetical protein
MTALRPIQVTAQRETASCKRTQGYIGLRRSILFVVPAVYMQKAHLVKLVENVSLSRRRRPD